MAQFVVVNDYISIYDDQVGRTTNRLRTDAVAVADIVARERSLGRVCADAIVANDSVSVTTVASLKIVSARALTNRRVRVDFSQPAVNNSALSDPRNYVFKNTSAFAVDVVPQGVRVPAGQTTPLYVEVETTEHTDKGQYEVGLRADVRGVNGEFGSAIVASYQGIGTKPALKLVLATAPDTVEVHFTEPVSREYAALNPNSYTWAGALTTLAVISIIGSVVTLQTTKQEPGQLYTLRVQGETDVVDNAVTESLSVADSVNRQLQRSFGRAPSADAIVVTDAITARRTRLYTRNVGTDALAMTDSIARMRSTLFLRTTATDAVVVADTVARVKTP